jgi:hypothetical protein
MIGNLLPGRENAIMGEEKVIRPTKGERGHILNKNRNCKMRKKWKIGIGGKYLVHCTEKNRRSKNGIPSNPVISSNNFLFHRPEHTFFQKFIKVSFLIIFIFCKNGLIMKKFSCFK